MGIGMRPHYRDHDLKIGQCLSNEVRKHTIMKVPSDITCNALSAWLL